MHYLPFVFLFLVLSVAACSPEKERPPAVKPISEAQSLYNKNVGYCYYQGRTAPWEPEQILRGEVLLRGKREGKIVRVEHVFYRLKGGTLGPDNHLEIQSSPWGLSRSTNLSGSSRWKKVRGMGLPRPALRGAPGRFSFQFDWPIKDQACSWTFRF